jgi:hypothetical protein
MYLITNLGYLGKNIFQIFNYFWFKLKEFVKTKIKAVVKAFLNLRWKKK